MQRRNTLAVTFLSVAVLTAAAAAQRRGSPARAVELQNLITRTGEFESKALRGKARYRVFLPKDYDAESEAGMRYPTILFLHGMFEDSDRFYTRGGAEVLDRLVGDGTLPAHVFVCADDSSRRSFYINSKTAKVEDMILKDLVPHVDATFRTEKGRGRRALLGVSMGGFGALKIAFKHPEMFGVVATHSAAILPEKYGDLFDTFPWAHQYKDRMITPIFGNPVDEELWRAVNPMILARKLEPEQLEGLKIYFDCGDKDRYGFQRPNASLHEVLQERKIPHTWRLVEGGAHGWNTRRTETGYNQTALPHSLRFIAAAWKQKAGVRGLSGLLGGKGDEKGK